MGHIIAPGIGTASLDGFGGLVTQINPSDLPENASPRTWDTDFLIGSVFTRPGLQSVYVFTATILINAVVFTSGNVAIFEYAGKQPLINEQYVLSGFTGATAFLNGLTVTVESSNATSFTVVMSGTGTYLGLSGIGTSTTGDFAGPNLGSSAVIVPGTGTTWANPDAVYLPATGYASTFTGTPSQGEAPGAASNTGSVFSPPWNNPGNISATGAMVATVQITLHPDGTSQSILANGFTFVVPPTATVLGVSVSLQAGATGPVGSVLNVSLANNGTVVGTPVVIPISSAMSPYTAGGPAYQWGTTLDATVVQGSVFGVLVRANGASGANFSANSLVVVVYYSVTASEALNDTGFDFSIPATAGISGFGVTFQAYAIGIPGTFTTISMQLLKNGVAVGTPETQAIPATLLPAPIVYTLGSPFDLWGTSWLSSDVNNTMFGVQIIASGDGTTSIQDVDILAYLIPGFNNFNYIKSYIQNNGQTDTLALDASGIMWKEDVTNNPGTLSIALTGIFPGSFAKSATADDQEYILFSNEAVGTDRPRVYNGTIFTPLSQVGPGAPPAFAAASGISGGTTLTITAFEIGTPDANVVTFTFNAGPTVAENQIYNVTGAVPNFLNIVGVVLGTPAPTATTFSMTLVNPNVALTQIVPSAIGTLQFNYPIASITQNPAKQTWVGGDSGGVFWGANPGPTHTAGTNLFIYYSQTEDKVLDNYFAAHQQSTYVYITGVPGYPQFANQTYLVTAVGNAKPSSSAGAPRFYFAVNVGVSGDSYQTGAGATGTYQMTIATITTTISVGGLNTGDTIQITGETPTGWNGSWAIVDALKSSNLNIQTTTMSAGGVATYTFSVPAGGVNPVNGQTVSVIGATNSAAGYTLSPFNTVGTIVYPGSAGAGSFDIDGFTSGLPVAPALDDSATAQTFGTQFNIDPGQVAIGSANSPIYGPAGATTDPGGIYIVNGQGFTPITAGTRQAVCFFITSTGYETPMSPPVVFTVPSNTTSIQGTSIPIGPPNTVARGIAFTEAGQNGVPGANFYVIPNPVTVQVLNGAPVVYKPTIIYDNTTQYINFTFTDAVLLNSTAVDIQGNDLFNLIELGSSAWCVPYASRMFYGLQLNKVDNFNNLTFDGGYIPPNPGQNIAPLGWQSQVGNANVTLVNSPVTGMAAYFFNNTGAVSPNAGLMIQPAFQDPYKVPIIKASTTYSVRVTADCPSGNNVGTLLISLATFDPVLGYQVSFGGLAVPLTSMTTNMQVFTGTLLTTPFTLPTGQVTSPVPTDLFLALQVAGLGPGADCLVDRIEVFPTEEPYLLAQVYGSYVDNQEAVDASGSGGIVDTTAINPQSAMGGFVMHNVLYLLKTDSMVSTEDNPSSEPGGWGVQEVSNKVGSIGISAYDVGEENCTTACRDGIYGFNGGQPVKIMQEIWQVWNLINWKAGNTIVLKNDIVNRRILCAVPLATPNQWLPFDPVDPAPTSPNVILMCNYQGLNTFDEMLASPQMHTTMFGTLAAVDMKRKWSIWHIKTPYMEFISRQAVEDKPLFICNGIDSSKVYQLMDDQLSDDGVAIYGLYTTYGFVNAAKAATLPIFGFHHKRYTVLQGTSYGAGNMKVVAYQNTLGATYPYTVPGGVNLQPTMQADWYRNLNQRGNRLFLEFSTDAVGSWFNLSKLLLSGKADNFPLNPTGGGNQGFPSGTS